MFTWDISLNCSFPPQKSSLALKQAIFKACQVKKPVITAHNSCECNIHSRYQVFLFPYL